MPRRAFGKVLFEGTPVERPWSVRWVDRKGRSRRLRGFATKEEGAQYLDQLHARLRALAGASAKSARISETPANDHRWIDTRAADKALKKLGSPSLIRKWRVFLFALNARLDRANMSPVDKAPLANSVDELVTAYAPLARRIAARWFTRSATCRADCDDLVQAAMFGLLTAARRYDQRRGGFVGWASPRIAGAVRDHLRALDPMSRDMRTKRTKLEKTTHRLRHELGREPTPLEIAAVCGCSLEDYEKLRVQVRQPRFSDLDAPSADGARNVADFLPDPNADLEAKLMEQRIDVEPLFGCLNEKDKRVMRAHFVEGRKMLAIALDLGVTESRVCQIVQKCIALIRQSLPPSPQMDS